MLELSTAGVTLQYVTETTPDERPTSGYKIIPGIKSIPDFNPEPNSLQVTDLSDTEFHRYISGLRDLGGSLGFGANHTQAFMDEWDELVQEFKQKKEQGLATWFAIVVPGLENSMYFAGEPAPLGMSAMEVDAVLEINAYIAPNKMDGWQTKPAA